jgi:hypothetical protein
MGLVRRPGRQVTALLAMLLTGLVLTGGASHRAAAGATVGFDLIGHDPLWGRGMNAAPALYNDGAGHTYVYVGSRTDSTNGHPHPGVAVVDATNPAAPTVVNEIGGPNEGRIGVTSRELRVWPAAKLLIVMHFTCSSTIHACDPATDNLGPRPKDFTFYDLSTDPVHPAIAFTYTPTLTPHEMYLWVDPVNAGRALLYYTTPASSTTGTNLVVADITPVTGSPRKDPVELVHWSANADFTVDDRRTDDVRLHSLGVSPDGTRAYLAYLGAGFLVLDTSPLTNPANTAPVGLALKSTVANRAHWGSPGTHSAVPILGARTVGSGERRYALSTDEVYGDALTPIAQGKGRHGCPWGWVRTLDITDEAHPTVVGEYRAPENDLSYCVGPGGVPLNTVATSYSSHNPTVLKDLAFVTWHSSGLRAIDLANPAAPTTAGVFLPDPEPSVATEDPALSEGLSKVVLWSYPILNHQGASTYIYAVDVRNGLYILHYTGPRANDVDTVQFLEGNSNLGDALALDNRPPLGTLPGGLQFGTPVATTMHFDSATPVVGEVDRAVDFQSVGDGPRLTLTPPTGPPKAQSALLVGNKALAGNPLLGYFSYFGPVKLAGPMALHMWLAAPGAPGVVRLPLNAQVFVDGAPALDDFHLTLDVLPVPTEFTIPLGTMNATALNNIVVQIANNAVAGDANAKHVELFYGAPQTDSVFTGPMAFPVP